MIKRIKLALCVGTLLLAGVACEESDTDARTAELSEALAAKSDEQLDPAFDSDLTTMAAEMTWDSRTVSEQANLCLAYDTFDKAHVMAMLTADMTGTVAENLALGEALYAKFTEECS